MVVQSATRIEDLKELIVQAIAFPKWQLTVFFEEVKPPSLVVAAAIVRSWEPLYELAFGNINPSTTQELRSLVDEWMARVRAQEPSVCHMTLQEKRHYERLLDTAISSIEIFDAMPDELRDQFADRLNQTVRRCVKNKLGQRKARGIAAGLYEYGRCNCPNWGGLDWPEICARLRGDPATAETMKRWKKCDSFRRQVNEAGIRHKKGILKV